MITKSLIEKISAKFPKTAEILKGKNNLLFNIKCSECGHNMEILSSEFEVFDIDEIEESNEFVCEKCNQIFNAGEQLAPIFDFIKNN